MNSVPAPAPPAAKRGIARLVRSDAGILLLFIAVCVATAIISPAFLQPFNAENLVRRSALFGIISIGAAFVIAAGGIDLSIGAVVCLTGILVPWLLVDHGWPPELVVPTVLATGACIGLIYGLLVTKLRIQPFLVTLCGLLIERGLARGITNDQTVGFRGEYEGIRFIGAGSVPVPSFGIAWLEDFSLPMPVFSLILVALASAIFLHSTVWGRWLLATGRNREAARYSGIPTDRLVIFAFMVCSTLSAFGGYLFISDVGSAQPADFGNFYELYAIAAAVLGGCSLRGGEVSITGVVVGAALMQVLRNAIVLAESIPDNIEYAVIGGVILAGVIADELVRRAVRAPRT